MKQYYEALFLSYRPRTECSFSQYSIQIARWAIPRSRSTKLSVLTMQSLMSKSAFSAEGPVHLYLLHWSQHGRQITFLFSNVTSPCARATLLFYLFLDHKLTLFVPFLPFISQRFHLRVFTMLHLVRQNRNTDCQWPSQGACSKVCWKVVVGKLTTT